MSRKTRKLIWSVPLVAVLAIVGGAGHVRGAGARERHSRTNGDARAPPAQSLGGRGPRRDATPEIEDQP